MSAVQADFMARKKQAVTKRNRIEFLADDDFIAQITQYAEDWKTTVSAVLREAAMKMMMDKPPPPKAKKPRT